MIWLAWRQQRVSILVAMAAVVSCAVVAIFIGIDVRSAGSVAVECSGSRCPDVPATEYRTLGGIWSGLLMFMSLAIGALTGGPLFAREAEKGTSVLALTQSVSRIRWWAVKLAVGGGPVILAMLGLGLLNQWAFEPVFREWMSPLMTPMFDSGGIVVAAYTLFAFIVAAVLGSALKHSIAAMSITIAAFVMVMAIGSTVRPYYAEPEHVTVTSESIEFQQVPEGAMSMGISFTDAAGNDITEQVYTCLRGGCDEEFGVVSSTSHYHSADRYWYFQVIEGGALVLLSVLVAAAGMRVIRTSAV